MIEYIECSNCKKQLTGQSIVVKPSKVNGYFCSMVCYEHFLDYKMYIEVESAEHFISKVSN